MGLVAITVCVRQQNPRVPFIAVLALIVFVLVAAMGMFVSFAPRDPSPSNDSAPARK